MSERPDTRLHPYRDDIAAAGLRDRVDVPRYVEGVARQVTAPAAGVHAAPDESSMMVTEALFGETVTVFDEAAGWAWGQISTDGYVGYLRAGTLSEEIIPANRRVTVLRTPLYPRADLKSTPARLVSMNALLPVTGTSGDFLELAGGRGFVFAAHTATAPDPGLDYVEVARAFLGTPYLWGGRQSLGLDCSGLVQNALAACGIDCLRDSDMQETSLGAPLDGPDPANIRRGDFLFWAGHVAIAVDATSMIHASGHHMAVAIEPTAEAVARIEATGKPLRTIRRL